MERQPSIRACASLNVYWNGLLFASVRTLEVMSEQGYFPKAWFARQQGRVSKHALLVVTGAAVLGVLLGEDMLGPVLNAGALSVVLVFALVCIGLPRHRKLLEKEGSAVAAGWQRATPVFAILGTVGFAALVVVEPVLGEGTFPVEWMAFAMTLICALGYWVWRSSDN